MATFDLDLGENHTLEWTGAFGSGEARTGAIITHKNQSGEDCFGAVSWVPSPDGHDTWQIEGERDEHLTLSPSILCRICGDHGFIRDGKWVKA